MVLVGGGVVCPLVWPLRAAAPGKVDPAAPPTANRVAVLQTETEVLQAADVPTNPSWGAIAPFPGPAVAEASLEPLLEPRPVAPLLLLTFTWTGGGADDNWSTAGNWSSPVPGYPDDCNDDATIPYTGGGWDIVPVAVQMDDLTISSSVDFAGSGGSVPVLKADSITLTGDNDIEITVSNATVKTFGCP